MAPNKQKTSLARQSASLPEVLSPPTPQFSLDYPKMEAEFVRSLRVLLHPNRQGREFGLLCVRVDATDAVDALLGAAGVERLLADTFHRLRNCVRTTDVVAGGERGIFFILATDLQSEDELEIISDRIQRTCRQPYWIQDQEIRSGLTTGGVGGSEAESDPTTLMQHAVLAMQRASSRGVAFEFFNPPGSKRGSTPMLASAKQGKASEEAFELDFLPQYASDRTLSGVRVTPRIAVSGPQGRAKSQAARASERKKNERIGDRVLHKLLLQAQSWTKAGLVVPALSIEIGANHLLNPGFADSLLKLLSETRTAGAAIDLLLTEATTLTSLGSAQRTLTMLAEAGVKFGLTGFSLNAGTRLDLRKLPFSSLRVSCSSLFKATSASESLWLARSIVGVAHRCGLAVVGEDVETQAQRDILLDSGCDRFEGPLYSPAIGAMEIEPLLQQKNSAK